MPVTDPAVFARVRTVVATSLAVPEEDVRLDSCLITELGADSLDFVFLSEGLRPSDSPTPSLARRFAGSLRSGGSRRSARSLVPGVTLCGIRSKRTRCPI
jgi:hypothetical protein